MRWCWLLLCMLLPAGGGRALAAEKAVLPAETIEIRGVVVDEDGQPVARARIWAGFNERNVEAKADAGGRFAFELPKLSVYFRIVAGDGGERMGLAEWWKDRTQKLGLEELRIELNESPTLEVAVTDIDGKPVAGGRTGLSRPHERVAVGRDRRRRQGTAAVADRLEL